MIIKQYKNKIIIIIIIKNKIKIKQTKLKHNKTNKNKTKIKENIKMALTLTGSILSKISFCDKQCSNVNDNKAKAQIIQDIDKKYGIQIVTRDYNIINPNIVRNVLYHQHILTPYTHGNPYMLYLTRIDNINCALFIDKKLKDGYTYPKIHCVKYRFSDELYEKDTIFTGELVRDNERRWFFLIDNLLLYKGMKTNEKNILSKFELINKIMENDYTPDKYLEICPLYIKKLFLYKDIKKMVNDFIPNLSYMCKGIVFYTLNNKHSNYLYMIPRENQIQVRISIIVDEYKLTILLFNCLLSIGNCSRFHLIPSIFKTLFLISSSLSNCILHKMVCIALLTALPLCISLDISALHSRQKKSFRFSPAITFSSLFIIYF